CGFVVVLAASPPSRQAGAAAPHNCGRRILVGQACIGLGVTDGIALGWQERAENRPHSCLPWQCLYFLPEPQGHGALRETLPQVEGSLGLRAPAARLVCSGARRSAAGPSDRIPAASAASAMASSSSPVKGSTWWACMGGSSAGISCSSSSGTP